jgi:hypothetical protein
VAVGDTLQLTAKRIPPLTGAVTWTVKPDTLASVDQTTGLVTGLKSGDVTVTATVPATATTDAMTASFHLQVILKGTTISGITVTCKAATLQLGTAMPCVANGTYVKGKTTDVEPVPAANFVWKLLPPSTNLPNFPLSLSITGMVTGVALTPAGGGTVAVTGEYVDDKTATVPAAGVPVTPSAGITVGAALTAGPKAQFGAAPVAGTSSVTVLPQTSGDTISIWAFLVGSGFTGTCGADNMKYGRPLQIQSTTGTGSSAVTTTTTGLPVGTAGSAPSAAPLTINELLIPGEMLCLVETPPGATSTASWSNEEALAVTDPNDFGRVRPYFVLGMQATNQQTASGNSSVAQYLEVGLNFTNARARDHRIGLGSNLDLRISPIPVAGSVSTLSGSTLASASITPNQLSSQQSVRGAISLYAPMKVVHWNHDLDYFTWAPLARAGVGTLLNSSMSSSIGGNSGSAPTQIATTTFAPGLYFWGLGARIAWDRMGKDMDKAPQTITQFLMTVGEYSNLPSYVCKPTTGNTNPYATSGTPAITTACSQFQVTGGPTSADPTAKYNYYGYFRTVRPRLDVEGLAKLPGYPFVLGLDANLEQYAVFKKPNLDYLNKPGNDVRIWVGISVDIRTLVSKL